MFSKVFHFFVVLAFLFCTSIECVKLEYGGVSFDCYRKCGFPEFDEDAQHIYQMFYQLKCQVDDLYFSRLREGWTTLRSDSWYEDPEHYSFNKCTAICRRQSDFTASFELLRKEFNEKEINYYKYLREQVLIHEENIQMIKLISLKHIFFEYKNGRVIGPGTWANGFDVVSFLQYEEELLSNTLQELQGANDFAKLQDKFDDVYKTCNYLLKKIFIYCLENHQVEGILVRNALEAFFQKEYFEAIDWLRQLLIILEGQSFSPTDVSKVYLLTGQLQSEYGQYAEAIQSLTQAIIKSPDEREAYLERATAYFELGDFEKAIEDYLHINIDSTSRQADLNWQQATEIGLGIGSGILKGIVQGSSEFLPEILNSLHGFSRGLWACCTHPIGASTAFVNASLSCIEYIKTHSSEEMIALLVPELRELLEQFDQLKDFQKGQAIGQVIGKYGIDIFLAQGSVKIIRGYRELKRANQTMTLEALTNPKERQKILQEATSYWAHREQTLKSSNLKIQWDKQGKHLEGHKNYTLEENKSILKHSDPNELVKKYAGKGIKVSHSDTFPGQPGYKEVVDFNEFIGYKVDKKTGLKTPTNRGTIHYAKDGVHIVPTEPGK